MLIGFYIIFSLALFLFSFTQVDLSLALNRTDFWQVFQKTFQYIGFYQRPLATLWYLILVGGFFGLYIWAIRLAQKQKLTPRKIWQLIFIITGLVVLSYPALSYDVFNYMFTAKTVLLYKKNPYTVIPLDFVGVEPWLSFMRWTHLPSAYTPIWIVSSLVPYLTGLGYFLLILWSFKLWAAVWYVLGVWLVEKIMTFVDKNQTNLAMAIFALNPLIIFESLVSGHNDIMMIVIALAAYYFYLGKRTWISWLTLSLSVAVKMMTIFLLPVAFLGWNRRLMAGALILAVGLTGLQREILPWYWVWVVPLIALVPRERLLVSLSLGVSLGLLLTYAPYFYFGHYNDPVASIKLALGVGGSIVGFVFIFIFIGRKSSPLL